MKNLFGFLATAIFAVPQLLPNAAKAEDGPLACGYNARSEKIQCDVVVDKADIAKVVVNRGRCYIGQPLSADAKSEFKTLLSQKFEFNQASPAMFRLIKTKNDLLAQGLSSDEINQKIGDPLAVVHSGEGPQKQGYALFFTETDPTGILKFGDKLVVNVPDCNVIEYMMTVNGQDWTWSTR